ncbi:M3 family metallopeptidase [Paraglaciecola aquimarina]|uniref:M3 family metallopeptidase n=1 Tax=Paraglaciecola aquimarina TaxID=1235557 RepID=A0ABU3SXJ4_9ALTE|nr:M3 family metallopeptidase [Paraglaciecola aquimarina]MDU0354724.1 M3 family metallopeptidase [Paraglaciecola aquimarina]
MRTTIISATVSTALFFSACSTHQENGTATTMQSLEQTQQDLSNVLMRPSPLSYQAPEFDKLSTDNFEPAINRGMQLHSAQINKIANNPAAATFENTLVEMEKSGQLLERASGIFFSLSGVISDDEYLRIEAEISPKLTSHYDSIYLNNALFKRVAHIYETRASLAPIDKKLTEFYYHGFVRAGAKLDEQQKQKMRQINEKLSSLETEFSQNILASFKQDTIIVQDKAELAGLSEDDIASLAAAAQDANKDGYMITLVNTTRQPILSKLSNRSLREKIWQRSATRAMDTNGPVLRELASLRAQKSTLLGFANWASYATANQMAKTPEAVFSMLDDLAPKAVKKAKLEAKAIEQAMHKDGVLGQIQPWDWEFYAEKVRKAKYDLDEDLVKPYFELNSVLEQGLFFAMEKLYGIHFSERLDLPVYHPDVRVFEVFNQDNSSIGLFYFDPYAREGKGGGAWMDEFVTQSFLLNQKPVVFNVLNIVKPAKGQATLLTFEQTTTLFHEFGHAAHGLFSQVKYPSLAGTATARDFVEFPSQFTEDWAIEPSVMANYAKHYKTAEMIPAKLLEKVMAAIKFNQGFDTVEYLAAALLDMEWHVQDQHTQVTDVEAFEQQALAKHGINYAPIPSRYKSAYFSHSFAGGYSASYYAYLWTEVFAADAFAFMQENGGLTRENGDKFRKTVLSKGNSEDLMQDFIHFRGQQPTTDALLKRRGLVE